MKEIRIKVPTGEQMKKIIRTIFVVLLAAFLLLAIGRPNVLMDILEKFSTKAETMVEANIEKKELEQVIFMEDTVEYFVMYSDGTFDHTDVLDEVARMLTDKTGKAYAVDNGKLMAFDNGKLTRYEIHYGWKK